MRSTLVVLGLTFAAVALAADAPPPKAALEEALARGLERSFNCVEIPVGSRKLSDEDKAFLKPMEPQGLLTFHEGEDGAVSVSPTKLALDHRDRVLSRRDAVVLRMGTCEVQRIIKNAPYTGSKLPQSAEYRFVMGSYKVTPTPLARQIDTKCDTKEHKFRAIVEVNPFSSKLTVRRVDWGEPDEETWKSDTVE